MSSADFAKTRLGNERQSHKSMRVGFNKIVVHLSTTVEQSLLRGVKPAAVSELAISRLSQGLQQPEGTIEEVVLQQSIAKQLEPKLCFMERQCQAAFFPIEVDVPGQAETLRQFVSTHPFFILLILFQSFR